MRHRHVEETVVSAPDEQRWNFDVHRLLDAHHVDVSHVPVKINRSRQIVCQKQRKSIRHISKIIVRETVPPRLFLGASKMSHKVSRRRRGRTGAHLGFGIGRDRPASPETGRRPGAGTPSGIGRRRTLSSAAPGRVGVGRISCTYTIGLSNKVITLETEISLNERIKNEEKTSCKIEKMNCFIPRLDDLSVIRRDDLDESGRMRAVHRHELVHELRVPMDKVPSDAGAPVVSEQHVALITTFKANTFRTVCVCVCSVHRAPRNNRADNIKRDVPIEKRQLNRCLKRHEGGKIDACDYSQTARREKEMYSSPRRATDERDREKERKPRET